MKNKWQSLGDFARAVWGAGAKFGIDDRLSAAVSPSNESVGSDGGYAVPPEVREDVVRPILGEDSLLARTDRQVVTKSALAVPADATPPWAGPTPAWQGEGVQLAEMKTIAAGDLLRLHKLSVLLPVTAELYEDAVGLNAYLRRAIPVKFDFAIADAMLNGTGAGQILGLLAAGATITQTKEAGQGAATVVYKNVSAMWNRLYGPARATAVWALHPDAEQQLQDVTTPSGEALIKYWPDALPTIFGRPAIVTEAAQPLGTRGDLVLFDPRAYLTATRQAEGVKDDVSLHVWFDRDLAALRFTMRLGGQPWLAAPWKRYRSTETVSTSVALETRA